MTDNNSYTLCKGHGWRSLMGEDMREAAKSCKECAVTYRAATAQNGEAS